MSEIKFKDKIKKATEIAKTYEGTNDARCAELNGWIQNAKKFYKKGQTERAHEIIDCII
ncbi:MAG: hypothetical protein GXY48_08580 [Methanomicrobiales archaeon]|nr:hypothetical protein [Methanomicrobiales archaeon]